MLIILEMIYGEHWLFVINQRSMLRAGGFKKPLEKSFATKQALGLERWAFTSFYDKSTIYPLKLAGE